MALRRSLEDAVRRPTLQPPPWELNVATDDEGIEQFAFTFHPDFADAGVTVWWGDPEQEWGLATLEGGKYCILSPSGLAGVMNVNLGLLKSGDELLLRWSGARQDDHCARARSNRACGSPRPACRSVIALALGIDAELLQGAAKVHRLCKEPGEANAAGGPVASSRTSGTTPSSSRPAGTTTPPC